MGSKWLCYYIDIDKFFRLLSVNFIATLHRSRMVFSVFSFRVCEILAYGLRPSIPRRRFLLSSLRRPRASAVETVIRAALSFESDCASNGTSTASMTVPLCHPPIWWCNNFLLTRILLVSNMWKSTFRCLLFGNEQMDFDEFQHTDNLYREFIQRQLFIPLNDET